MESTHTLVQTRSPPERGASSANRREDALVLGRYRLLERLGAGGFGVVWRAQDQLLHREVAVKRIPLAPDGDGERASREALATARLAHPAIVALYEACAVADAFYLISELVRGQTLAKLIASRALTDEQVLAIAIALTSALAHAHSRGVIHRDVKPQNVLVPDRSAESGEPDAPASVAKLTDFGGASLAGEEMLTRTGETLGTLAYMAPEQSEGREATETADLYSLALVVYEALTGVNPVRAPTPAATVRRIGQPIEPLGLRRPDLPRTLTRALDRALAPASADRGTLGELRRAFDDARKSESEPPARARSRAGEAALLLRAPAAGDAPRWQAPPPRVPARARTARWHARAPRADEPPRATVGERGHPSEPEPGTEPESSSERARSSEPPARLALPRKLWIAGAASVIAWQVSAGRPGAALLLLAAFAPLAALPRRSGGAWLAAALAPVLGLAGLAGAFPAVAGQASPWRLRAALGALGYWWLTLAEPLLAAHLWLGQPSGTPARAVWEGSVGSTGAHVIGPLLGPGVLFGAALWAAAAVVLPWIVRGRNAWIDVVAVTVWSTLLAAAAPLLDSGLSAAAAHAAPRGAILGAVFGAALAVAARALRGPV